MRRAITSSEKNGLVHAKQVRQPTFLTTRGGLWSTSSTGSRRFPPSYAHRSGSTKPRFLDARALADIAGIASSFRAAVPLALTFAGAMPLAARGLGGAGFCGWQLPSRHACNHAGTASVICRHTPIDGPDARDPIFRPFPNGGGMLRRRSCQCVPASRHRCQLAPRPQRPRTIRTSGRAVRLAQHARPQGDGPEQAWKRRRPCGQPSFSFFNFSPSSRALRKLSSASIRRSCITSK